MPCRGVIRGLDRAFRSLFQNFRPGPDGVSRVSDWMHVSLPVPLWSTYQWWQEGDLASVAAGNTTPQVAYTVPAGVRALLEHVMIERVSGDNTITQIATTSPSGYGAGTRRIALLVAAAAVRLYWPLHGNATAPTYAYESRPVLLEPGSTVTIEFSGAGAAASVFNAILGLRLWPLPRTQVPS